MIDNDILHGQILPIKGRIEKTLQNALHHADIHLTLRVAAPEEIKRIPTKREVLAEMLKENKAISKLCQALDLQMAELALASVEDKLLFYILKVKTTIHFPAWRHHQSAISGVGECAGE